MLKTRNDLGQNVRTRMVDLLNENLALSIDLAAQTKQAHWNVRGPHFIALHELFDKLHDNVRGYSDTIAERAAALGGLANGTVQAVAAATSLKPYPLDATDGTIHCEALSKAFADFAKSGRKAIDAAEDAGDKVTADLFTGIARSADQDLWFIEAHLQAKH